MESGKNENDNPTRTLEREKYLPSPLATCESVPNVSCELIFVNVLKKGRVEVNHLSLCLKTITEFNITDHSISVYSQ
jgi:hypothetical protein